VQKHLDFQEIEHEEDFEEEEGEHEEEEQKFHSNPVDASLFKSTLSDFAKDKDAMAQFFQKNGPEIKSLPLQMGSPELEDKYIVVEEQQAESDPEESYQDEYETNGNTDITYSHTQSQVQQSMQQKVYTNEALQFYPSTFQRLEVYGEEEDQF